MRFVRLSALIVAVVLGATGLSPAAHAEKRLALVIGINAYRDIPPLEKAVGDARAVAATLRELGFEVTTVTDAGRRELNRAVTLFQNQLQPGDVALVHYSGHGVELDGQNYLLPADVPKPVAGAKDFIKAEALALGDLMDRVAAGGARTRVFVIDACRDNPFAEAGTRGVGGTRGLARVEAPAGTFILYSAGYRQTALDRLSDNDPEETSVYTRVLTRKLREQGKSLSQLAKEIRQEVEELARSVGHEQRPAYYDELSGSLFIAGMPTSVQQTPPTLPAPTPPILPQPQVAERDGFETAQSIDTAAAWDAFLARFPTGFYADMARAARDKLASLNPNAGTRAAEADVERRLRDFIKLDYLKADFRDGATIRKLYASQVDYWGRGLVAIDTVIAEKVAFALAWTSLELDLDEPSFAMSRLPGADKRYAATFQVRYELRNATSSVTGTSETSLEIAFDGGRPIIVAEKGRILTSKVTQAGSSDRGQPPASQGTPSSYWTHNGSVMYLVAEGDLRRFYYHKPRPELVPAGAKPGSLLFAGRKVGDRYEGTAYTYSRNCGQFPYPVAGQVEDGSRRVVMHGQVPQRLYDCRVAAYRPDELVFEYLSASAP